MRKRLLAGTASATGLLLQPCACRACMTFGLHGPWQGMAQRMHAFNARQHPKLELQLQAQAWI